MLGYIIADRGHVRTVNYPMASLRTDTNHAVQPQKVVRGLKFLIKKEEGLLLT